MHAPLPKEMKRGCVKIAMGCQAPPSVLTDFSDYFTMCRDVNPTGLIKKIPPID